VFTLRRTSRQAFTLIELLIAVSVIALMATMMLFALYSAQEMARAQKTKALVGKLDSIVKVKYEAYKTRRVPISLGAADPQTAARVRLDCLRDLMRLELPDRWSDITDDPATPFAAAQKIARPAVSQAYRRRLAAVTPTDEFQGAECLYMIVMAVELDGSDDRSAFKPDQIADVDSDGYPEFIDAWGSPIQFLRWAPGFASELQIVGRGTATSVTASAVTTTNATLSSFAGSYVNGLIAKPDGDHRTPNPDSMARIIQYTQDNTRKPPRSRFGVRSAGSGVGQGEDFIVLAPDPFDPRVASIKPSFALYPLVYSAGPDKAYGVLASPSPPLNYVASGLNPVTPVTATGTKLVGNMQDIPGERAPRAWVDNIHNHAITAR